LTGLFTNGLSLWTIFRTRHLWNAFGYSCASHAAGACGVLVVFVIYVTPMTFFSESIPKIFTNERVSYSVGQLSIAFYYGAVYAHILIATNRFVVISKPLSYTRYFSKEMTLRWIAVVWAVAILQSCMYQIDGCHYYYLKNEHTFTYSKTSCGEFISMYLEFGINLAFVFFVVVADTLTVIKLKVSSKVSICKFYMLTLLLLYHYSFINSML
uniref:G_PROTEIN_RECEP_F1_2 domain-containing protein n=1 Tax=Syphacia muris TaxID=451379 RepID=A0A0N5AH78_9BILA